MQMPLYALCENNVPILHTQKPHLAQRGGQRGKCDGRGQARRSALRADGALGAARHALQRRGKVCGAPICLGASRDLSQRHGLS